MAKKKDQTFEEALAKLEAVVEELEKGEIPIEKAIVQYERGAGLLKTCRGILDTMEKKIEALKKDGTTEPFGG